MFYAVAYGHVIRYEKAGSEREAAKLAFGMVDVHQMTVRRLPKSLRSLSRAKRLAENQALAKRHFRRTGSVVAGYENEPGIKDVHWTRCPLCLTPITTEPASAGVDGTFCQSCEPKILAVPDWGSLSVAELRECIGLPPYVV